MAHDVFISYSNLDRTVADAAVAVLESRKVRCWIAPRDVTPGLDWSAEIVDAIERSAVMVLIYSANANESPQIKREVERGVNRGIPVIPFRIQDVPLSKALEYFITWRSTTSVNGQMMQGLFTVAPAGAYGLATTIADSGRFIFRNTHRYYLVSVTGSRIELRDSGIDAFKATFTGPLGAPEWRRVGLPTNSEYPVAGEWHTTAIRDSVPWQMELTIDDHHWQYRLVSSSIDEGAIEARGGQWTMRSRTQNGAVTSGTHLVSCSAGNTGAVTAPCASGAARLVSEASCWRARSRCSCSRCESGSARAPSGRRPTRCPGC